MENIAHGVWTGPAWRAEVAAWITDRLAERGATVTGPIEQPRVRPWSTQLTVPTSAGPAWFKANAPGLAFEAGLLAALATWAPDQVLVPWAVDAPRGWMLSPDAGPTLSTLERTDEPTWIAVLQQYAELQRTLAPHRAEILATGVPELGPAAAGDWTRAYAAELAGLPAGDPSRIGPADLAAVHRRAADLDRAAAELTAGPVPLSIEHNDLHTDNTFVPVPGSRLLFFDFGDALWAHPFTSVWLTLRSVADGWQLPDDDPRLDRVADAYLEVWTDLAPLPELRRLRAAAARFGPVHRTHSWWRCLSTTEPRYWAPELITAGHDWLLRFAYD